MWASARRENWRNLGSTGTASGNSETCSGAG
jgi:hypothetical protein